MSRSARSTEEGTMQSYVVGFILSLIFTLIPYHLVVNQTVKGNALLATILGFALVQMLIQITFFLHLGRGPKPRWNVFFFAATVGIILIVVGGSILIINNLHYNMSPPDQVKKLIGDEGIAQIGGVPTGACQQQHANHPVTIKDGEASPVHTTAIKCDTLTFIDADGQEREIVFGKFPADTAYAGETDLIITKGHTQTVTLSESGKYQFYDHLHRTVVGYFTVK